MGARVWGLLAGYSCCRRIGRLVLGVAITGLVTDGAWWITKALRDRRAAGQPFLDVGQATPPWSSFRGRVVVVDGGGFPVATSTPAPPWSARSCGHARY